MVYRLYYSTDGSLQGYLKFSLSYLDPSELKYTSETTLEEEGLSLIPPPTSISTNSSGYCLYRDFRNPPWAPSSYNFTEVYWQVMLARVLLFVLFENLILGITSFVAVIIPDTPVKVIEEQKWENHFVNELILHEEKKKARLHGVLQGAGRTVAASPTHRKNNWHSNQRFARDACDANNNLPPLAAARNARNDLATTHGARNDVAATRGAHNDMATPRNGRTEMEKKHILPPLPARPNSILHSELQRTHKQLRGAEPLSPISDSSSESWQMGAARRNTLAIEDIVVRRPTIQAHVQVEPVPRHSWRPNVAGGSRASSMRTSSADSAEGLRPPGDDKYSMSPVC